MFSSSRYGVWNTCPVVSDWYHVQGSAALRNTGWFANLGGRIGLGEWPGTLVSELMYERLKVVKWACIT